MNTMHESQHDQSRRPIRLAPLPRPPRHADDEDRDDASWIHEWNVPTRPGQH